MLEELDLLLISDTHQVKGERPFIMELEYDFKNAWFFPVVASSKIHIS